MKESIKNRLLSQGYCKSELSNPHSQYLTRWTPFMCVIFGTIGIAIQSPIYFLVLGLLTCIGAFSSHSFYDYIYKFFFSFFLKWGQVPKHSFHRKIGCGMGAIVFFITALGIAMNNVYLSYIPVSFLMIVAYFTGIFNWCFVTSVINLFSKKKVKCCTN